jgi:hypothetical protein
MRGGDVEQSGSSVNSISGLRGSKGTKALFVAVVVAVIVLVVVIAGLAVAFHGGVGADSQKVGSQSNSDALGFGADQNDAAGYGGFQWGSPITSFIKTVSSDTRASHQEDEAIPECPAGSEMQQFDRPPYVGRECKLPEKSNDMEMCSEWDGHSWSETAAVPCGSRVSSAVTYTGPLTCPIAEQVYLLDSSTGKISNSVTCLPEGWVQVSIAQGACPSGSVSGSPALFGQDDCYGPPPPPPPPEISASFIHADSSDDPDDNHTLAKIFNVPDSEHGGGMLTYRDTDFSVIPPTFQSVSKDDSEYIFYKGRLAMVFSTLDVHHRDQIVADLKTKYQEVGTTTYGWSQHTLDEGPQDSTTVDATLFKRGSTNTRIYVIDLKDVEGIGVQVSSLRLLYIPTSFMWEIQKDIMTLVEERQSAATSAARKAAQPDMEKLQ